MGPIKKRQLFQAINKNGKTVLIDKIKNTEEQTKSNKYFCPYCKHEVIPKTGEKKVWHFAHKDEICEYLNIKKTDKLNNQKLDFSKEKTISLSELNIGDDCEDFLCNKCKERFRKEIGIKWDGNTYLCKDCFAKL